jgi:hypothetical protein
MKNVQATFALPLCPRRLAARRSVGYNRSSHVEAPDTEQTKVLSEARQRAQKLLEELLRQQADLLARPPKHLDPQQIEAGKAAVQKAVNAAKRVLQSVDDALGAASATSVS